MTEQEIRQIVREELSSALKERLLPVGECNVSIEAIIGGNKWKSGVASASKRSHERSVEIGRMGGRGNKKGRLKKE